MSGNLATALGLPDRRAITISEPYDPMDGLALPTAQEEIGGFFDDVVELFTGKETTSSGEFLTVAQTDRNKAAEAQALDEKNAVALAKIADTRPEVVDAAMAAINMADPSGKIGIPTADRKEIKRRAAKARNDLATNDAKIKQAEAALEAAGKDAAKDDSRRLAVAKDDTTATQPHAEQMAELLSTIRDRCAGMKRMETKIARSGAAHTDAIQEVAPYEKMKQDLTAAHADAKIMEAKAAIVGALTYGPLSDETPPDLDAAQQKALIKVCGKNPTLGVAAMEAILPLS
ncbi:hypothetical protein [Sedimentitalea sp.]|uniref:hypothetical protein n=1 Tax=Sedimentitalea sp. TaxID=2048915 RepID=UPI003299EEC0